MSRPKTLRALAVGLALTTMLSLQTTDRINAAQIPLDAVVQFGPVHPQPGAPHNHVLVPDEVTILKGGTVTFQVNGGGHGVAIYPVSRKTTRADIEADLCPGGPGTAPGNPVGLCPFTMAFPPHVITDAKGDVIVDIPGIVLGGSPVFDYLPGRVLGANAGVGIFLNGSTNPPPPAVRAPGVWLQHRFEKTGRFLVICMNRFHAINDYMFGFVNVVGDENDNDVD